MDCVKDETVIIIIAGVKVSEWNGNVSYYTCLSYCVKCWNMHGNHSFSDRCGVSKQLPSNEILLKS